MAEHLDIRMVVDAPVDEVWTAANDPAQWSHAGHPVQNLSWSGDRVMFSVTTPPDDTGCSFSYTVERTADVVTKTVYSRRLRSPDFLYSHVWFSFTPSGTGTEIRCVVDFELTAQASITDERMAALMERRMRKNMAETARRIERDREGPHSDG